MLRKWPDTTKGDVIPDAVRSLSPVAGGHPEPDNDEDESEDESGPSTFRPLLCATPRGLSVLVRRYDGDPTSRADTPGLLRLLPEGGSSQVGVVVEGVDFVLQHFSVVMLKGAQVDPPSPGLKFADAVIKVVRQPWELKPRSFKKEKVICIK
jgi:hypothetical protein